MTASEMMTLAQQQLSTESETALGQMQVYLGERLIRTYQFVFAKRWEAETVTECVRIDFETATTMADGDSARHSHNRYLLRRVAQAPPTQWLYLPALRRVRIAPYRPEEPLLQSNYLFYDLTAILNFGDYEYHFRDPNEGVPVIDGEPRPGFVPYDRTTFVLERRGTTYLVTTITYSVHGQQREATFLHYEEITPGRFRPRLLILRTDSGRTELAFRSWVLNSAGPELFTGPALETRSLTVPVKERNP
jgi:hypothetical protein